ncbi:hypothetical protein BGZ49_004115, partial [Haplosporangium sp. Z 27]
ARSLPFILFLFISICIPITESVTVSSLSSSSSSSSEPLAISSFNLDSKLPSKVHIVDNQDSPILQFNTENTENENSNILKRAVPATTKSETSTKTKNPAVATTSVNKPSMSPTGVVSPSPSPTMAPDSKGDTALFGKPSVIGSFNLTSGILIYTAFMILFIAAVGSATWRRAKYRTQFRDRQQRNMGSGYRKGGGDEELSDAALFKQASISKRALMQDVGHGGTIAAHETIKTKIAAANGAGRSFEEREQSGNGVRFGESNGTNPSAGTNGRTGGMKKSNNNNNYNNRGDINQGAYEMNSYGLQDDTLSSISYSQDNHDLNDYSRPPLTENADPYYSSGSSHSGFMDQFDDFQIINPHGNSQQQQSPKVPPKAAYQNPGSPQSVHSQVFAKQSGSVRMPRSESPSGRGRVGASTPLERNGSGNSNKGLDRTGSGGRSRMNSPRIETRDLNNMSRAGSNGSSRTPRLASATATGSPTLMHPTPISRSNSTRLPPSMRGGGGGTPTPSGLSQQNSYM